MLNKCFYDVQEIVFTMRLIISNYFGRPLQFCGLYLFLVKSIVV